MVTQVMMMMACLPLHSMASDWFQLPTASSLIYATILATTVTLATPFFLCFPLLHYSLIIYDYNELF